MNDTFKTTQYQRMAKLLIKLYPTSWRERYEEEMLFILEKTSPTLFTIMNLFISLIDAHIHRDLVPDKGFTMLQKIRAHEMILYGATFIFFAAWIILQASVGHTLWPSTTLDSLPLITGINHLANYALLILLVIGGLPIMLAACWKAIQARKWGSLLLCLLSLVSPLVTAILVLFRNSPTNAQLLIFIGLFVDLGLIALAIQRVAPSRRITSYAFYISIFIPVIMLIGLATILPIMLPALTNPWNDAFYIARKGIIFLIMLVAFAYSLIALKNSMQSRRTTRTVLKQETLLQQEAAM